jgi:hypothetical protein
MKMTINPAVPDGAKGTLMPHLQASRASNRNSRGHGALEPGPEECDGTAPRSCPSPVSSACRLPAFFMSANAATRLTYASAASMDDGNGIRVDALPIDALPKWRVHVPNDGEPSWQDSAITCSR